jgi:hypothetical protein
MIEMRDWHKRELNHREHYQDLLREVDRARLVREAQAGRERQRGVFLRVMIWLGQCLAAWRQPLQPHSASDGSIQPLPVVRRPQ